MLLVVVLLFFKNIAPECNNLFYLFVNNPCCREGSDEFRELVFIHQIFLDTKVHPQLDLCLSFAFHENHVMNLFVNILKTWQLYPPF